MKTNFYFKITFFLVCISMCASCVNGELYNGNSMDSKNNELLSMQLPADDEIQCKEGSTALCEKQEGVCNGAKKYCIDGKWDFCRYGHIPGYVEDEAASDMNDYCDGLDNDCNGVIDDGCFCNNNSDCPDGYICDDNLAVCVIDDDNLLCHDDYDCPDGYICDDDLAECVMM